MTSIRESLAFLLVFLVALAAGADGELTVDDPTKAGPYSHSTGQYKFKAVLDKEVLSSDKTELWARVHWPKDLSSPRPILFFLHGNHSTCGKKSATGERTDDDCTYTTSGKCPTGMTVTPNHEGFNYVGSHLASHGFIVVSINANRGITCGGGVDGDFGLNLARGRLILRHLEKWHQWATQGGAPKTIGGPDLYLNKVDFQNVGLMGHSRGGEGARAAYVLYNDQQSVWQKRIPDLRFKALFEIGAVDGQTDRTLDPENVAWNQLLPMCDGDVYDMIGRMPFERLLLKRTELKPTPKSLYMVWGANHNYFNSEWHENDSTECVGHSPIYGKGPTSQPQQNVAVSSMSSFFLANVGRSPAANLRAVFDPVFTLPPFATRETRIDRDFIPTFDRKTLFHVDFFDQPTGTSSRGQANLSSGVKVSHEKSTPNRAKINWDETTRQTPRYFQTNWAAKGVAYVVGDLETLDFRVARQDSLTGSKNPTNFSVALVDANDSLSIAVPVERYASVLGPANNETLYQTIRIPIRDFNISAEAGARGVRFIFDGSPKGAIYLANVHFTGYAPERFPALVNPLNSSFGARKSAAPIEVYSAKVVEIRRLQNSQFLNGGPAVEITISSQTPFPPRAQLPILVMKNQKFRLSRYSSPRSWHQLIFTLPAHQFDEQRLDTSMYVQYGNGDANKIWRVNQTGG